MHTEARVAFALVFDDACNYFAYGLAHHQLRAGGGGDDRVWRRFNRFDQLGIDYQLTSIKSSDINHDRLFTFLKT